MSEEWVVEQMILVFAYFDPQRVGRSKNILLSVLNRNLLYGVLSNENEKHNKKYAKKFNFNVEISYFELCC